MNEWKPLNGRITVFPVVSSALYSSTPSSSIVELYRRLWDGEPDGFQNQNNALLPTVAHGKRNGLTAQLLSHPARIDLNLLPASDPDIGSTSLVLIEDTNQFHTELKHLIEVFSRGHVTDSASRVAISVQFVNLQSSVVEANKAVAKALPDPYRIKLTDEHDFVLQLNRPRPSRKVEGIGMNFLTKWSTERLQVMRMAISSGGVLISPAKGAQPDVQATEFPAASLSFDHNNAPDPSKPLKGGQQSSLLAEGLDAIESVQKEIGLNVKGF
jgi:hypothetical protein